MADILIRGMGTPQDCNSCVFCENEMFQKYCPLSDNYYYWDESSTGNRPSDCPLLPLPEGHGRLGDLDKLEDAFIRYYLEQERNNNLVFAAVEIKQRAADMIGDWPTIVPAEGGHADA